MYLVDEKDYLAFRLYNFVYDRFQTFFELAFVHSSRYECSHIERKNLFRFQVFGHVASDYSLCEPVDYGGLTRTRFADKYGVVFGTTAEYLQYTPYFVVSTDYGVELAVAGFVA